MDGAAANIKHVVVLMFENRSFDHLFGAFPGANGIFEQDGTPKPDVYNLPDPTVPECQATNPRMVPLAITPDAQPTQPWMDVFDHNFGTGMMHELFGPGTHGWLADKGPLGAPAVTWPKTNCGFLQRAAEPNEDPQARPGYAPLALSYFQHDSLQVLHKLAAAFVLCDNWYCDIPGDTLLNRYFMHTAQTDGYLDPNQWNGTHTDAESIFERIEHHGAAPANSWKIYANWAQKGEQVFTNDNVDSQYLDAAMQATREDMHSTDEFAADAAAGTLPFYSFLMCWMPHPQGYQVPDTSMHPVSDIRAGENMLAAVYAALRNSPSWDDTLLVVTFDESGGFYDHVPPPEVVAPNDKTATIYDDPSGVTTTFDFTLLGPRVPTILVSPWLRPGIAQAQYQCTSLLKFLENLSGAPPLTRRDAEAPDLAAIFTEFGLTTPREDCPASFPCYPDFPYADGDLSKRYEPRQGDVKGAASPALLAKLKRIYGSR